MIRQLDYQCWYFDCDPWEEPHFPTKASADEVEIGAAEEYEYDPRPVQHCAAPCWVAACDRCECPAGDEDEDGVPAHYRSEEQLLATLNDQRWALGDDRRVCCADCAAVAPLTVQRVPVTIDWAGSRREVLGEVTACADLLIVPGRSAAPGAEDVWLGLRLVHRPTGRYLPTFCGGSISVLHWMAELLAGLDWSCPDVEHYATGYAQPVRAADQQASAEYLATPEDRTSLGGTR